MAITIPPIKSQGIKTKLVPWINDLILTSGTNLEARWIEPFFGTGVVGFNSPMCGAHIVGDTNPHIIGFYKEVQNGEITPYSMRAYLERESKLLESSPEDGYEHFRQVRDRFNSEHSPYDFIFLSRAGFNGMMRFNRHGDWNVPFCKKPDRFSPAYITKICNQVGHISQILKKKDWKFDNVSFKDTIAQAKEGDIIYCDPPYFGRYVDYYNGWTEEDEQALFEALRNTLAKFILSTWHHNDYRSNEMIERYWKQFNVLTKDHFYHNGGKIENRHSIVEALVFNFDLHEKTIVKQIYQLDLFGEAV
ncbi:MAG: Dam family site-specific DNA-(adenine-N6)-methyltransferase [Bacteroidales bacterium]|nr:Dam family site-specific DNA-(adenine-N6)-methyltransferase [Bacteroidales bacterium]